MCPILLCILAQGERENSCSTQYDRPPRPKECNMHPDQRGQPTVLTVHKVPIELIAKGLPLYVIVKIEKLWRERPKGGHTHHHC